MLMCRPHLVLVLLLVAAANATTEGVKEPAGQAEGGGTPAGTPIAQMDPKDAELVPKVAVFSGYGSAQVDAFLTSLAMIIVSELGDKTFFIAAILAMKQSRIVVLAGAFGALALMTVLSAAAGRALPALLPRVATHWASVLLFFVFGIKLIKEGIGMKPEGPSEELEEVEHELGVKKADGDEENGGQGKDDDEEPLKARGWNSGVLWQAFTLTFLAEWGDRSQIATIALAASKDAIWVTIGGTIGHGICTGIAVVGGRMIASKISERTVTLCGGALFLVFAIHGALQTP